MYIQNVGEMMYIRGSYGGRSCLKVGYLYIRFMQLSCGAYLKVSGNELGGDGWDDGVSEAFQFHDAPLFFLREGPAIVARLAESTHVFGNPMSQQTNRLFNFPGRDSAAFAVSAEDPDGV